ncbi:MAG: hypothetical protein KKH66_15345, partial [Proteobacteria bacterium]|nr:hypothetical protein [Pseudomonadota bacterium]
MKRSRVLWPVVALLAVMSISLTAGVARSAGPNRVVILPFTANSQEDISFLTKGLRDMLASRLPWQDKVTVVEPDLVAPLLKKFPPPYNEAKAREIG